MTPQESLNLLAQASGLASLTREQHSKVVEAVNILQQAITPKETKEKTNSK